MPSLPSFLSKKDKSSNQNDQAPKSDQSKASAPPAQSLEEQYASLIDTASETVYEKSLRAPIRLKVLKKLGVGRSGMFRSTELNAFRQALKDEARDQARSDVAEELSKTFSESQKLERASHAMNANAAVYKDAKKSVNAQMEKKSDEIVEQVLPADFILPHLKLAAKSALEKTENPAKREAAVLEYAQKRAKEMYKPLEELAIDKARYLVKGDDKHEKRKKEVASLKDSVRSQVKSDEIGKNAVKASIEAPNFNSALTKIAPLIKQTVPYNGDSAELSIEIKIPVPPGGFIIISLGTTAEHDDDYYELGVEANIGGGGSLGVLELSGTIGLFVEAKGNSEVTALNLMSYGMYRHMSTTFPSVASRLWGAGGDKTGFSRFEKAEIWAAIMEKSLMDDGEQEVSVGQQAALTAAVETGIYEGEFTLAGKRKTTYNKEAFENLNSDEHLNQQVEKQKKKGVTITPEEIAKVTFGNDIDLDYIIASQELLGKATDPAEREKNKQDSEKMKEEGRKRLEARSKRFKEIEAEKSVSVSTEHTLSLPFGSLELEAGFEVSSGGIEGEIGFSFPEMLEDVDAAEVFNFLVPKITGITSSAIHVLQMNSDEQVNTELNREHVSNAIQDVVNVSGLDGAFEELYGSSISASLGFEYNSETGKLELTFSVSKDRSSSVAAESLDLEVFKYEFSKSSKIFEVKKEFQVKQIAATTSTP